MNKYAKIAIGSLVGGGVGYFVGSVIAEVIRQRALLREPEEIQVEETKEEKDIVDKMPSVKKNYADYFKSEGRPDLAQLAAKYRPVTEERVYEKAVKLTPEDLLDEETDWAGIIKKEIQADLDETVRESVLVEKLKELKASSGLDFDVEQLSKNLSEVKELSPVELVNIFDQDEPMDEEDDEAEYEEEIAHEDMVDPRVVTFDEYADAESLTPVALLYYEDDIVTDAKCRPVDRPERILGDDALVSFEDVTDIVYVLNNKKGAKYEIKRVNKPFITEPRKEPKHGEWKEAE